MSYFISIMLMVVSSLLAAFGQLSLKIGSQNLSKSVNGIIKNYMFLAGILLYGVSTVIGVIALRGSELTVLYPVASLNYVWVSLLSVKYLREKMNGYKWLGILLIITGVAVIV